MRILCSIAIVTLAFGMAGCDDDPTETSGIRTFNLNSINQSTVSGTAVITDDAGENSTVEVTLTGLDSDSEHAGHVHQGSCIAAPGAVVFGLDPLTANSEGSGSVVTTSVPDDMLTTGFYIQYHLNLTPPGAPIACGNIPAAD